MFCHEKDARNVVTGWFSTKNDQSNVTQVKLFIMTEIFIGSSKHQKTVNLDVTK